jgi:macrolide-specific efflux system membrane fusion protein
MRLDRLRVEAFVHFKKLPPLPVGRAATLHIELPGGKQGAYRGQIVFLHPEVNPVNGQVRVWAEVENDDLLLQPGMRGTLEVEPAASPQNSKTRAAPPQN